jgi:hypothetical protein
MSETESVLLIRKIQKQLRFIRVIFELWDRQLYDADKEYILRRIKSKEPDLFEKIARE